MTKPIADLAFLGKKTITPDEHAALVRLGGALQRAGIRLHIALQGAANLAINDAYRQAGGKPVIHTTNLHKATPVLLVYGDEDLIDKIVTRFPTDVDTRKWHLVTTIADLDQATAEIESIIPKEVLA